MVDCNSENFDGENDLKKQIRDCKRCFESEGKIPTYQLNRPGERYGQEQKKPFQYQK